MNLEEKLNELEARSHGDYWIVRCPECGHKEAYIYLDDVEKHKKNPSFKIPIRCNRLNKCGKTSYMEDINIGDIPKIKDDDIIGISQKGIDKLNTLAKMSVYLNGFDFDWRGISNKTMKENGVIFLRDGFIKFISGCGKNSFADKFFKKRCYQDRNLIFPIKDYDGNVERMLLRSTLPLDEKAKKEIGMRLLPRSSEVWNRTDLVDDRFEYIFITEGVPDGLSIKEATKDVGVVSLPGVKKYRQLTNEIKAHESAQKKKYVICFDNDEAGKEYLEKLSEQFDELNIEYSFFNLHGYKDLNDFLQGNRELFIDTVLRTSKIKTGFRFKKTKLPKKAREERKEEMHDEITTEFKSESKFRFIRKQTNRTL